MNSSGNAPVAITRRNFIHMLPVMGAGVFLGQASAQSLFSGSPQKMPLPGRVVHVNDVNATSWDFSTGWYGDYVDQAVVDAMVERGLTALTGETTVQKAWKRLIPGYVPGQKIAIKVNFNNFYTGDPDPDPDINALIEPVNAIVKSLKPFGAAPGDITVYDVTHGFHDGGLPYHSFVSKCLHPGVHFVCYKGLANPFSETELVHFNCPPPPKPQIPDLAVANVVVDTDYLINMPIVKAHAYAGATLGFKNHLGSIDRCDYLHPYFPHHPNYQSDYSPMLDLFLNPHFRKKTVLTVGDCLFGNWYAVTGSPIPWIKFGNQASNSLFFSADPVAADSVMMDVVEIERQQQGQSFYSTARDFLVLAEGARLGIHESGDPWKLPIGSGYKRIFYIYVN